MGYLKNTIFVSRRVVRRCPTKLGSILTVSDSVVRHGTQENRVSCKQTFRNHFVLGPMLWFKKNIFAKKSAKKWCFWLKTKAKLWKNDHNIGFWEKLQFFRRKLSKIAENCDRNIDPCFCLKLLWGTAVQQKWRFCSVFFSNGREKLYSYFVKTLLSTTEQSLCVTLEHW
jgi:hypothetical protein